MENGELKTGENAEFPEHLRTFVGDAKVLFTVKTNRLYPKVVGGMAKIVNAFSLFTGGCFVLFVSFILILTFSFQNISNFVVHFTFSPRDFVLVFVSFMVIAAFLLFIFRLVLPPLRMAYLGGGNNGGAENWFVATEDELIVSFLKDVQRYSWNQFTEAHVYNLESGNWVGLRRSGQRGDDVFLCELKDPDLVKRLIEEQMNKA